MKTYQYITIAEYGRSPSGNTRRYEVRNKQSPALLAVITWHGPWRQYVATFRGRAVFSAGCLRDVVDFIESLKVSKPASVRGKA